MLLGPVLSALCVLTAPDCAVPLATPRYVPAARRLLVLSCARAQSHRTFQFIVPVAVAHVVQHCSFALLQTAYFGPSRLRFYWPQHPCPVDSRPG